MDMEFPELKKFDVSNLEHYYEEKIVQLFYLLSRRDNDDEIDKIGSILEETLRSLKTNMNITLRPYLILLYKMIAQTRDIVYGKGERKLTYMMIYIWYKFYPTLAIYAIHRLVDIRILPDNCNGMDVDELVIRAHLLLLMHRIKGGSNLIPACGLEDLVSWWRILLLSRRGPIIIISIIHSER